MKKKFVAIFTCIILFICICIIEFSVYKLSYTKNKEKSDELLKIAYEMIDKDTREETDNEENYLNEKNKISDENGIIGVLVIKNLDIEAPVKEGTSQDVMKTAVGHFEESDYWNGNVSLASHNSGSNVHYFEKINSLKVGDEIKYITKIGTKRYRVKSISKIRDTDWSMVMKNSSLENTDNLQNTITLITCISWQPDYRLCVRGVEM